MESLLLIGPENAGLKRLKNHLVRAGFRVAFLDLADLGRLEKEISRGRFVLGVLDATHSRGLQLLIDQVRSKLNSKELPLMALVQGSQLGELDGITGLEDFLLSPINELFLETRIRFLLKRFNHLSPGTGIRIGALEINPDQYEVLLDGEPLELTYKEFELVKFLATHPSRVFDRDQLLNQVWGYDFIGGTRTVDVHIRRLRAKLGPKYASLIGTIRNVGYKFSESL